jgi:hypothetical protein
MYDDAQDEDDAHVDPNAEDRGVAMARTTIATQKRIARRTAGYTTKEDVCLCRYCLAISQDSICGAEQKEKAYWKRVIVDFHERRQLRPFKIHSDCGQFFIQNIWSLIKL